MVLFYRLCPVTVYCIHRIFLLILYSLLFALTLILELCTSWAHLFWRNIKPLRSLGRRIYCRRRVINWMIWKVFIRDIDIKLYWWIRLIWINLGKRQMLEACWDLVISFIYKLKCHFPWNSFLILECFSYSSAEIYPVWFVLLFQTETPYS